MNIPLSKMGLTLMMIVKCGKQNRGRLGKRRQRGDLHVFIIILLLYWPCSASLLQTTKRKKFRSYRQSSFGLKTGLQQYQNTQIFSCHFCGQPGHWKATCPQRQEFIQPFNPFIQPIQPLQPEEGQQTLSKTKTP